MSSAAYSFWARYDALGPKKRQIVQLICKGWENRAIAEETGLSYYVVKNYVVEIKQRLGAESKLHLAVLTIEMRKQGQAEGLVTG